MVDDKGAVTTLIKHICKDSSYTFIILVIIIIRILDIALTCSHMTLKRQKISCLKRTGD